MMGQFEVVSNIGTCWNTIRQLWQVTSDKFEDSDGTIAFRTSSPVITASSQTHDSSQHMFDDNSWLAKTRAWIAYLGSR